MPKIDFALIRFATDQLTIGALRQQYPGSFDRSSSSSISTANFNGRESIEDALGGLIDFERRLALLAFNRTLKLPPTPDEQPFLRESLTESVTEEYIRLGLAAGEHHAEQLIRDMETQVVTQARGHLPPESTQKTPG